MIPEEPKPRPARIGDNMPPSPIESVAADQRDALKPYVERRDYVIERAKAKQVKDRSDAGDAGDIIAAAKALADKVQAERKELTDPLRKAAERAKGIADEWLEPLEDEIGQLRQRLEDWQTSEDDIIAAQTAEQGGFGAPPVDSAPAPTKETAWPQQSPQRPTTPPKKQVIRGDLGSRVSTKDKKQYRVVDVHKVPDIILNSPMVHEAIISAAKSIAKVLPEPDGIEITTEVKTDVR